jgi:hypothetical protein
MAHNRLQNSIAALFLAKMPLNNVVAIPLCGNTKAADY